MGIKYLWDTNTAIYFLQNQLSSEAEQFLTDTLYESRLAISAITEIELLCWRTARPSDVVVLSKFVESAYIFELEQSIKLKAVSIRKEHNIKLPDAIIAATSVVHKLTLITRNTRDFRKISGLQLINPFD